MEKYNWKKKTKFCPLLLYLKKQCRGCVIKKKGHDYLSYVWFLKSFRKKIY